MESQLVEVLTAASTWRSIHHPLSHKWRHRGRPGPL